MVQIEMSKVGKTFQLDSKIITKLVFANSQMSQCSRSLSTEILNHILAIFTTVILIETIVHRSRCLSLKVGLYLEKDGLIFSTLK